MSVANSSSPSTSTAPPFVKKVHLLVLVHGMWGTTNHLYALSDAIKETHPKASSDNAEDNDSGYELEVLTAETNQSEHTYDGIDYGGERVIEEIRERITSVEASGNKKVTRFSITGYSLGGLIARYMIGALHSTKFFDTVEPVNFNAIATPHIGLPRYPHFLSRMGFILGPRLLGRTGQQFFGTDKFNESNGKSMLECLADPEMIFVRSLLLFKNVVIFANTVNDKTVPYVTAAIETEDPFLTYQTNGLEITYESDCEPVVKSYLIPSTPPPLPEPPKRFSKAHFQSMTNIPLPPFLRFQFPLNLLAIAALPIVFPIFLSLVITRLSLQSRKSNARIKLIDGQRQSDENKMEYLKSLFRGLEKEMDDTVADLIDRGGSTTPNPQSTTVTKQDERSSKSLRAEGTEAPEQVSSPASSVSKGYSQNKTKEKALLTPTQIAMAKQLNAIPHLKKRLVFIDNVPNSHTVIIAREAKRSKDEERGMGVVKCWADGFEL